jgi:hypothetical protein
MQIDENTPGSLANQEAVHERLLFESLFFVGLGLPRGATSNDLPAR